MPTPAQRSATYRAQQRNLLGDIAYKAQQSAQRQARRMRIRIINNPQLIPQVPALPINILQPQIPIVPIAIAPPTIPPRPNAQKLKQLLQAQKPPPIPKRPQKTPTPQTPPTTPQKPIQQPIKQQTPIQQPIQQPTPIKEPPKFKSRLNILLNTHNKKGLSLNIPDEYMQNMRKLLDNTKNNIRDELKETTLKQYNNKVLNFYNKFYKERLGEIPNNSSPLSPKYNEWVYDKALFINIKTAYDKPDTQRALVTAILSLVERDKSYEN